MSESKPTAPMNCRALEVEQATAMPPAPTAAEHQELKDRLLRTLAEMENLRTRTQREVEEARKFAVTGFARDLLEVGDNLGRALASVPAEARQQSEFMKNLVQGVEITERSLRTALEKHRCAGSRRRRARSSTTSCTRPCSSCRAPIWRQDRLPR